MRLFSFMFFFGKAFGSECVCLRVCCVYIGLESWGFGRGDWIRVGWDGIEN